MTQHHPNTRTPTTPPNGSAVDCPTAHLGPAAGAPVAAADSSESATRAVPAVTCATGLYPRPGDRFEGFEILSELGRGAVGRVYLAQQQAPVRRVVVLKVGQHLSVECQKLARLQHPNVVPVYSFHQRGEVQVVCMPYRGPLTLAHLVARLQTENLPTLDGRALTTVIEECRRGRQPAIDPTTFPAAGGPAGTAELPDLLPPPDRAAALFAGLRGLNYVDAVLTLIRQVVEGLRAAHAERIVHCDLKPGNVLISDDGCAQLIDFGISFDKSNPLAERLRLGGTRPYMSPEQLRSFATTVLEHDERSDLYAVGVMLYELLTGQYPFEPNYDPDPDAVERDRANRFGPFPPVRAVNPRVPHAVASIIGKCLAPDVAGRYQSAAQLLEDLDRQVARRPLRFAPNVSRRERVGKWAARNRVAVAAGVVLAIGGTAAGGVAYRDARNQDEIRRLAVLAAAEAFAADRDEAEFCFYPADRDPEYKRRAWAAARSALGRIGAWDSDGWADAPALRGVPADLVRDRRREAADLMVLLSHSRAADAARTAAGPDRDALLRDAQAWNRRAEQAHPTPAAARAIWCQRGFLARLAGDAAEEERHRRAAGGLARGPAEAVLEGRQLYAEGRTHAALAVLADALRVDPRNFWAAFYAGACHMANGESAAALSAFNVCNAIRPGFFGTLYNRAQARFRQGDLKAAEDDLDAALEARPDWAEAHFERAMVREVAKRYPDAIADATRALELGYPPTAVFLFRSRVYGRMGEKALADRDLAEGLKAEPTDERGWLARAQAQLYRDPARALADFAEALKLNPRQVNALQGTAHLLSRAGKNAEAADILTTLIGINPESPDAWSGRGVLRARLGDRAGALADAREALRLSDLPKTKYQVAGIHALFAKTHPDDRAEALSLLDGALRAGFGFDLLDKDKELDPLRADPDFTRTVTAARASWKARQRVD